MKKIIKPKKLLILCCECIYDKGKIYSEFLEDREVYKKQLLASIESLKKGSFDVLIISGGFTRKEIKKSEARGMLDWAKDLELNLENFVKQKGVILEEYARDSFENLLFSLCQFYQIFKIFPKAIGVIAWKFKENRIRTIAKTLKLSNFKYLAVGKKDVHDLGLAQFKNDPLHRGRKFAKKRIFRNPWKKGNPYKRIHKFREMFKVLTKMEREENPSLLANFKFPWGN